jgi:hypothetical protein
MSQVLEHKEQQDDTSEEVSEEMLEFLRSKTFNDDFKSLVNKVVFDNAAAAPKSISSIIHNAEDFNPIIEKLQRLFYKSVNLSEKVSTTYDPLGSDTETVYDYSLRYMKEQLHAIGLDEYALLCYNPAYKSYVSSMTTIKGYNPVNMVLAPEDPLYKEVINEAIGVVIEPDSPTREKFASKHFVSGFEDSTIFLISVQNILNIFWAFNENEIPHSFIPTSLYPVFVAIIRPNKKFNQTEIIKTLQQKIPFSFYIIHNKLRKDNVPPEYRTPAFLSSMVDTYCRIYGHLDSTKCYILKHQGLYSTGCYFFINYLWREISSRTGPNSTAVQIEKDRIVLFLSPKDVESIMNFINNELVLSEGKFIITEIPSFSSVNLFDILSR